MDDENELTGPIDGQIGIGDLYIEPEDDAVAYVPPLDGQVSMDMLASLSSQSDQNSVTTTKTTSSSKTQNIVPDENNEKSKNSQKNDKILPKISEKPEKTVKIKPKIAKNQPKEEKSISSGNTKENEKIDISKLDVDDELKKDIKRIQGRSRKSKTLEAFVNDGVSMENESPLFQDINNLNKKDDSMEKDTSTNLYGGSDTTIVDGMMYKTVDEVLHESMIPYSEHVILDRALPRVEDGLKPVQRRILYSMMELGVTPDKPYRKSARIVGDCMGKYHPHGDKSVYDAMVRLAQPFNTNGLLVDGHGNFGSIDGDSAAAMRYTEARLAPLALELLRDLDKDTVKWNLNFDDTLKEPDILPGRFPNLLVNGCQGIAVGLATNIPPHNLGEVIDGVVAYINNPKITLHEMMKIVKGPDFPTGGYILDQSEIEQAYATGKGKIYVRAKMHVESSGEKNNIVITEFPYQTNKVAIMQKIAALRDTNKELAGISEIRDESDRYGIRVVIRLKKDTNVKKVTETLLKLTDLQTTFGVNMVAIAGGKPKLMGLMDIISYYTDYQREVIYKRTKFELEQAKEREHILSGLLIAIKNINEVIRIIKSSKNTSEAKDKLRAKFDLSDRQAQAILDMRLSRLTNLEVEKLEQEIKELRALIKRLNEVLASPKAQLEIVKTEILAIKKQYKRDRLTSMLKKGEVISSKVDDKPTVAEVIVGYNANGNLKAIGKKYYNMAQKVFNENSSLSEAHSHLVLTSSDKTLLVFTNTGNCVKVPVSKLPESRFKDKGLPLDKISNDLKSTDKLVGVFELANKESSFIFVTRSGIVKKSLMSEYNLSKSSYQAIKLQSGDELIAVIEDDKEGDLALVTRQGMISVISKNDIPTQGRISMGVIGISLSKDDYIVGTGIVDKKSSIVVLTDQGNAKRMDASNFELSQRNRKGTKLIPAEAGKYVVFADAGDIGLCTLVVENGDEYLYKAYSDLAHDSRTGKGKGLSKKKLKLDKAYVYRLI